MFLCDVLAFGPASPSIYQRPRSLTVLLFMCYSNVSDTLMALNFYGARAMVQPRRQVHSKHI